MENQPAMKWMIMCHSAVDARKCSPCTCNLQKYPRYPSVNDDD